jgi:drug/metabolite transporter (DMT)-like permease
VVDTGDTVPRPGGWTSSPPYLSRSRVSGSRVSLSIGYSRGNGSCGIPSQTPQKHSSKWIYLILLAGVTATVIDIATKKMYLSRNPNSSTFLFYLFAAQSICFLVYDKYKTGSFKLEDQNEDGKIDRQDIGITVIMGVVFLTAICGLTAGVKKSPNVGYVKAIMMSSALMSTIAAKFIFGSPITVKAVCGMTLILGGVLYIAFTND